MRNVSLFHTSLALSILGVTIVHKTCKATFFNVGIISRHRQLDQPLAMHLEVEADLHLGSQMQRISIYQKLIAKNYPVPLKVIG